MPNSTHSTALTPAEQRKRALIDAGVSLVLTMLLWPFPIARAMLAPAVNVLGILLLWGMVSILYHVLCARFWRKTAATHLLGYSLADSSGSGSGVDDAQALRWGIAAGTLVVVNAFWGGASGIVERASGVVLHA